MNARLYNPTLHRFLSPDPIISDPYNTQHYNRYGYCWNNPLKHVDITGNEPISILTAIVIGAIIGAGSYAVMCMTGHADWSFKGGVLAIITGAVSGAVTCGIGTWAQGFNNFWSQASVSALAHGTFQGSMTAIQGGKFWSGFASGAVSSIVSSAMMGGNTTEHGFFKENNWAYGSRITHHQGLAAGMSRTVGTLATAAISGGAASALTGGNFWQGAATGLIVSGLNHLAHQGNNYEDVDDQDPPTKHGNKYGTLEEYREWRDYPGYHEGETKFDRICRGINSAHIEIMRDEGSGGGMMYGGFGRAAAIEQGGYSITKTVANNLSSRPYINSPSTIKNIMKFGTSSADKFFKGGVNYRATGTFRGNKGVWELGINPQTKVIYHFLFRPLKP